VKPRVRRWVIDPPRLGGMVHPPHLRGILGVPPLKVVGGMVHPPHLRGILGIPPLKVVGWVEPLKVVGRRVHPPHLRGILGVPPLKVVGGGRGSPSPLWNWVVPFLPVELLGWAVRPLPQKLMEGAGLNGVLPPVGFQSLIPYLYRGTRAFLFRDQSSGHADGVNGEDEGPVTPQEKMEVKPDGGVETTHQPSNRSDWKGVHYRWNRWMDRFNFLFRFCSRGVQANSWDILIETWNSEGGFPFTPFHVGLHQMMLNNIPLHLRRFCNLPNYDAKESEATPWDVEKESPGSMNLRRFVPPEFRSFIRDLLETTLPLLEVS
jgi:hypothetical protein